MRKEVRERGYQQRPDRVHLVRRLIQVIGGHLRYRDHDCVHERHDGTECRHDHVLDLADHNVECLVREIEHDLARQHARRGVHDEVQHLIDSNPRRHGERNGYLVAVLQQYPEHARRPVQVDDTADAFCDGALLCRVAQLLRPGGRASGAGRHRTLLRDTHRGLL
eukprot:256542-Rhodomonas_salina.2